MCCDYFPTLINVFRMIFNDCVMYHSKEVRDFFNKFLLVGQLGLLILFILLLYTSFTLSAKHISGHSLGSFSTGGIGSGDGWDFKAVIAVTKWFLGNLFFSQSLLPTLAVCKMPHFFPALPALDIIYFFHFCQSDRLKSILL